MNRTLVLCTAFLFTAALVAQDPPKTIRIGTWNIEQFGQRKPPRTEESVKKIADFIRKNRVEILAVQEVNGGKPLMRLCKALGSSWRFVIGTSGGFRNQPTRIAPGFVWDSRRVRLVMATELSELPTLARIEVEGRKFETNIFHRVPVSAVFQVVDDQGRATLDFRAIAVHLKASSRRRDGESDADFRKRDGRNIAKRCAEVGALRKYLEKLQRSPSEDQDIVVLGDFNHTYGAPAHQAFEAGELVRYLKTANDPATIVYFPNPIDHFAVTKGIGNEIVAQSRAVHAAYEIRGATYPEPNKDKWKSEYSDHLLVTLDLDASEDRDPDAVYNRGKGRLQVGSASRNPDTLVKKAPKAGDLVFKPGMRVQIRTLNEIWDDVTLLAPLDQWVVFRAADGKRTAVPAKQVRYIQEMKR